MNGAQKTQSPTESESGEAQTIAELRSKNEALHAELEKLQRENEHLKHELTIAQLGLQADRETRRAALNLMEDAVNARQAEQRENAERQKVEQELRNADRRKDEFLATLAHELRNPLAPIRNGIHILRVAGADAGSIMQIYEMMERQVNQLVRLVDDLMEVSRITRGKIELKRESIELAAVIRTAVETSRPLIDRAHHQLAITIEPDPLIVEADTVRLSQVLSNLLNNAAKYTDDGGQIWLNARRDGSTAVISVKDNGVGIPTEMLTRIFDLFTQTDRGYARSQGGLGIGLTLARTLVEMHGGTIEAHSKGEGHGSHFVVRLPLVNNPGYSYRIDPPRERVQDLPYCRVLIVDDNRDAAESLGTLLGYLGMETRTVNSGHAALECIADFQPLIVLLDIGLPGMDGNEIARRIRQDWDSSEMTLIALTGWGQDEDRRRTKAAGFDHHLIKPVDLNSLEALLRSSLIRPFASKKNNNK